MKIGVTLMGTLVGLVLFIAAPFLMPSDYALHLTNLAGIYMILVLGLNIVMGYAGQVNLGHAAFWGVGAYASSLLVMGWGVPFLVGMFCGAIAAAIVAWVVGYPTLKLKGHYLAMASLAFGQVVYFVLLNWEPVTNGSQGLRDIPPPRLGPLVFASDEMFFYLAWGMLIILTGITVLIRDSKFGRAFLAVREGNIAAEAMGVNVANMKVLAFVISAVYGGIAGSLYAHWSTYISPDNFSLEASIQLLVMLVVGGLGTLGGPLLGAFILTFLPEWLRFLKSYYMVVYGVLLIIFILRMPYGLVGLFERAGAWLRGRLGRAFAAPAAPRQAAASGSTTNPPVSVGARDKSP
ncbi:MAG: branched-chain amino acid ABC transporter permease [Candidatus Tectomicrobia bacterium]|nr:branched-chain amino acid ABC transporter permease [Candidatus Tectomicrobia bacterium]